jgi:hypothetical protein
MKIKIYILLLCLAGINFVGCSHFEELNKNPHKSSDLDPNLQIATVQMRQSENHQEWHRYICYPGGFMHQWCGDWATVNYGGHCVKSTAFTEQLWMSYYPYIIRDAVDVVQRTSDNPAYVNVNSIARIIKVENFLKLTDYYGDIPYFNAGMGYYTGNYNASYDKQEDIYDDFFKELSEASAALTASDDLLTHDLYYDGNIEKWRKFANSLHLRIAMRLIKINPEKARTEAEKAIAAGVFTSNDDICFVSHENYQNPGSGEGPGNGLATRLSNQGDAINNAFRLSTELISSMENRYDPRILYYGGVYYNNGEATEITQAVKAALNCDYQYMTFPAQYFSYEDWRPAIDIVVNGQTLNVSHSFQRLQPSKLITRFDAPFVHMTYAEVEFLLAEAAYRGWNVGGGSALSHFEKGLEAAVHQWSLFGVTSFDEAAIANFIEFNKNNFAGNELIEINTQLWILHFLDPLETWSNWRRTGIPEINFIVWPDNTSDGKIPRRMEYPLEEQTKNEANYQEVLIRMGGTDSWTNRVWWDKE